MMNIEHHNNIDSTRKLATLLTSCIMPLMVIGSVQSHGFVEFPKARQAICQAQGGYWWPDDGSAIPNLACKAAFLTSGYVPFVQEHEISVNVADYHNQAAIEAAIPDGTLCAAGSAEKDGLNLASNHWQKTTITPDANNEITLRFNAQTPHNPSFWRIYLSHPSFNADTDKLRWQDLQLIQSHGNIDFERDPEGNRYYYMQVSIPPERSGNALLYTRWQRNDAAGEGFYNCSDIVIERGTTTPDEWFPIAYFLRQDQVAKNGDQVWVRVFNSNGQELVSELFDVTTHNEADWQAILATKLTTQYPSHIEIGVKDNANRIVFDASNLLANQVWVTDDTYSYQLSITRQPDNSAPVVQPIDDMVLKAGEQTAIHVHAFDDDNDPLVYQWQIPTAISYSGENSDIQITAPDVIDTQIYPLSVSVFDGSLTTSQAFNVTVVAKTDPNVPLWDANIAYQTGERVTYQNNIYVAKWWNHNQTPTTSDAWRLESNSNVAQWLVNKAYQASDVVIHNQQHYRAQWWTKGEEPGLASVWVLQQ